MSNKPSDMAYVPAARIWTGYTKEEAAEYEKGVEAALHDPDRPPRIRQDGVPLLPEDHWERVDAFYADRYEFTNADAQRVAKTYAKFVITEYCADQVSTRVVIKYSTSSQFIWPFEKKKESCDYVTEIKPNPTLPPAKPGFDAPDQPVNNATRADAEFFCELQGKRLPTDMEWLRMARGRNGKESYAVKGGRALEEGGKKLANFDNTTTLPVGSYPPNSLGIYDLTGNTDEFVNVNYVYDSRNPDNPNDDVYRLKLSTDTATTNSNLTDLILVRGGDYGTPKKWGHDLLVADRNGFYFIDAGSSPSDFRAGFRCVKSVKEVKK